MLTFACMHHPYLVCILFGMPSLHLFTFLMFLYSLGMTINEYAVIACICMTINEHAVCISMTINEHAVCISMAINEHAAYALRSGEVPVTLYSVSI